jgi:hypothetical protein
MSKIALEGNAAGTGTFTIASPNSNTSRTLTLPDATGTVVLDTTLPPAPEPPAADVQTFNSSGTWTKPASGSMARIQVWGGGGGASRGGAQTEANGGGGGGYNEIILPLSSLGATESVTVGAGGAGRTGSNGSGTAGGTSSFGSHCTAYGGGAGLNIAARSGWGGESGYSTPSESLSALPVAFYQNTKRLVLTGYAYGTTTPASLDATRYFVFEGQPSYLALVTTSGGSQAYYAPSTGGYYVGGAGGAGGANLSEQTVNFASVIPMGANSVWGGGGGAGLNSNSNYRVGGRSIYGGKGGDSPFAVGGNGTAPGGGGGSSSDTGVNGGSGAAGRVIVTVW